jgi:excisionase family DNA binding protein
MFSDEISFNDVPKAVAHLINKVEKIETLLQSRNRSEQSETDRWLNLDDLCKYHPDHPAKPTVYAWIGQRSIPYHKKGKKLMFLKSEIDSWLKEGRRKTAAEIQAEAEQYVISNKKSCANREQNRTCLDFAEMQPRLREAKGGLK